MISLSQIKKNAVKSSAKNNIPVGIYRSEVLSVEEPKEFAPGEKVVIKYELTNDKGEKFQFKEEFNLRRPTSRTYDLLNYLEEYGIDVLEDFIGCEEEVEILMRSGRYGRNFASICNRKIILIPIAIPEDCE